MTSRALIEASDCDRELSAVARTSVKQQQEDLRKVVKQLETLNIIGAGIDKVVAELDLSKLPVALGAAFNSHQTKHDARCYPETRINLL